MTPTPATLALIAVLLCGCERPARSVAYFVAHAPERRHALDSCRTGDLRGEECETAARAEAEATTADAEATFRAVIEGK